MAVDSAFGFVSDSERQLNQALLASIQTQVIFFLKKQKMFQFETF